MNYGDSALNAVHYPTKVFTDRFRAMSIECTVTVIPVIPRNSASFY
jgi:hypothetical protein